MGEMGLRWEPLQLKNQRDLRSGLILFHSFCEFLMILAVGLTVFNLGFMVFFLQCC
jgi:hypothetical protein